MSTHAKKAKKAEYDPARQWGLKPEPSAGGGEGATYFVEGHVVAGTNDAKALFVGENIGRDAQARAARRAAGLGADRALRVLLERDREGARALVRAREFVRGKEGKREGGEGKRVDKNKGKGKGKAKERTDVGSGGESGSERDEAEGDKKSRGHAYSASLIKQLGFDPTSKDGRRSADPKLQSKVRARSPCRSARARLNGL